MTLDKAIEIQALDIVLKGDFTYQEVLDARELTLEAAKRIREGRLQSYDYFGHLLPGETPGS